MTETEPQKLAKLLRRMVEINPDFDVNAFLYGEFGGNLEIDMDVLSGRASASEPAVETSYVKSTAKIWVIKPS